MPHSDASGLLNCRIRRAGCRCSEVPGCVWHDGGRVGYQGAGAGVNGALTDDECAVVGAAQQLGLILSSDWPDVAAHLLAQGADGSAVSELAGLPRTASAWSVDQLVPQLFAELAIRSCPRPRLATWSRE